MNSINSFGTVTLPQITRYLKLTGWVKREDFPNKKLIVFDDPPDINDKSIQAVLPSNEIFKDYSDRLHALLYSLSEIEGRAITAIIKDIIHPNSDTYPI